MPPRANLETLAKTDYDLLIVGGGINGAGVAHDAAQRGLKVLLVDKGDWGWGTSSRSTKLVHGGLRYLEHGDLGLVFEASRERRLLWRTLAPHLVRPQPFLIPVYKGDQRPPWMIMAGLWLYDLLALYGNVHAHRMLSPKAAHAIEPALGGEGLRAAAQYWDCRMDDARLCLENVLAARGLGAACLNYCELRSMQAATLGGVRAVLRDLEGGLEAQVSARLMVNAAGPWADAVLALATGGQGPALVRPTKGVHLVTRPLTRDHAVLISARSDNRVFFVVPWTLEGKPASLIGTTDTDFTGDLDHVRAEDDDVEYLLAEARRVFPKSGLRRSDVWSTFAGVRPLAAPTLDAAGHPSATSREASFRLTGGVLSMAGGKYTTYRSMCEQAVDRCLAALDEPKRPCATARKPLPGAPTEVWLPWLERETVRLAAAHGMPEASTRHLLENYGTRAEAVLALTAADPALKEPMEPGHPALLAQAAFAAREEDACHLSDLFLRRTHLGLAVSPESNALLRAAQVMARHAWWDEERMMREITNYKKTINGEYR